MKANGLKEKEFAIADSAIRDIIRYYTRESGVRNLEREIAKICRKVVKSLLLKPRDKQVHVVPKSARRSISASDAIDTAAPRTTTRSAR